MKKTFSLLVVLLFSTILSAQNIIVESFRLDETDLDANLEGTIVRDQNGEKCALIKVRSTPYTNGFTFDVGQLGVMKVVNKSAETWLYVPHSVRRISIRHPQLGYLDDYDLGVSVERARTYILTLKLGTISHIVNELPRNQYLIFKVEPHNAMVEVNGQSLLLENGEAFKSLPFGRYEYKVMCKGYHDDLGVIILDNAGENKVVNVKLRPAFGWLQIEGRDLQDAVVYIDKDRVSGKIPFKTDRLASGRHSVQVFKDKYKPYEQEVIISDNQTSFLLPILEPNFAHVILEAMEGAEILVRGELVGVSRWEGDLEYGEYTIETRKASHYSQIKNFTIAEDGDLLRKIKLPDPLPKCGSLRVEVLPVGSDIYLDGVKVGVTPKVISSILEGEHNVEVRYDGRGSLKKLVTIVEKETFSLAGKLNVDSLNPIDAGDQSLLADKYYDGNKGLPQDYKKAAFWYAKAAEQGDAYSQNRLGICYSEGMGLSQDFSKAIYWYTKAAEQNLPQAAFNLGMTYDLGKGVKQDNAKALYWYNKSEELDSVNFVNILSLIASCHYDGVEDMFEKNLEKAVYWYTKAAEQGDAESQYRLGLFYEKGEGVSKNLDMALFWVDKAESQGHKDAEFKYFEIERELFRQKTNQQILEDQSKNSRVTDSYNHTFKELEHDATAIMSGTSVYDRNGEKCALIKVTADCDFDALSFDFGSYPIVKRIEIGQELWLYVQSGADKISYAYVGSKGDNSVVASGLFAHTIKRATTYSLSLNVLKEEIVFNIKGVRFKMKQVKGGTFTMGATAEQGNEARSDEKPAHTVTLDDYYIGETEVTQALWQAVMGTTIEQQRDKVNTSWQIKGKGDNNPMYYISWDECQEFIKKLNQLTGQTFSLPTEAQWEFAARGGNQSKGYKYSGSNNIGDVAWYTDNSSSKTHPVAQKYPNELGLFDMTGNVWEWCNDWYGSSYYSSSSQYNPQGPSSGSNRVYRGGSWHDDSQYCRIAYRGRDNSSARYSNVGLRLVLVSYYDPMTWTVTK